VNNEIHVKVRALPAINNSDPQMPHVSMKLTDEHYGQGFAQMATLKNNATYLG
jgi:hypothetical protein